MSYIRRYRVDQLNKLLLQAAHLLPAVFPRLLCGTQPLPHSAGRRQAGLPLRRLLQPQRVVEQVWMIRKHKNDDSIIILHCAFFIRCVAYLLLDTGFPCITTAFAILFLALLRATQVADRSN